jgi:hypothetical protein
MSKKKAPQKFLPAASDEQIAASEAKIKAIKAAARKPKKLKVEPVTETVVRCLALGKSTRLISKIVMNEHNYKISKDSIRRFSQTLPPRASAAA